MLDDNLACVKHLYGKNIYNILFLEEISMLG